MRVFSRGTERWEIEVIGNSIVTRLYDREQLVEENRAEQATELVAKWSSDRLCRDRLASGFARESGEADYVALSRTEFHEALQANPDELDNYLVYADWLAEHGDPWGEIILLQHALHALPRFGAAAKRDEIDRQLVAAMFRHSARIWGELGETIVNEATQTYACDLIRAEWHCGFIRRASIQYDEGCPVPVSELVDALAELEVGLLLRALHLAGDALRPTDVRALSRHVWPLLEHIDIGTDGAFHTRGDPIDATAIAPLCDGRSPRLAHVHIANTTATDVLCEQLSRSPLAPQLVSIQLERGQFTERGIAALADGRFESLQSLMLSAVAMPGGTRERLASLAPKVRVHDLDPYDYDEEWA